jgi:hypothetical protein
MLMQRKLARLVHVQPCSRAVPVQLSSQPTSGKCSIKQYFHGCTVLHGRGGAHAGWFNKRVRRSMRGRRRVSDDTNAAGASPRGSDAVRRAQHACLQADPSPGMYSDVESSASGVVCLSVKVKGVEDVWFGGGHVSQACNVEYSEHLCSSSRGRIMTHNCTVPREARQALNGCALASLSTSRNLPGSIARSLSLPDHISYYLVSSHKKARYSVSSQFYRLCFPFTPLTSFDSSPSPGGFTFTCR